MGGQVAAPVFKRIAEQVLAYLDLRKTRRCAGLHRASYHPNSANDESDASDFSPSQVESETAQADIVAAPPQRPDALPPAATLAFAEDEGVIVPSLAEKTVRSLSGLRAARNFSPVWLARELLLNRNL